MSLFKKGCSYGISSSSSTDMVVVVGLVGWEARNIFGAIGVDDYMRRVDRSPIVAAIPEIGARESLTKHKAGPFIHIKLS